MYTQLKEKLWAYIVSNNPDLMFHLQDEYHVVAYLEEKVSAIMPKALKLLGEGKSGHAIHELCLAEMTAELKPSRYHYICSLLREAFEGDYARLVESGLLTYHAVNLVDHCRERFDELHFCEETMDDPLVKAAITPLVDSYLKMQDKTEDT